MINGHGNFSNSAHTKYNVKKVSFRCALQSTFKSHCDAVESKLVFGINAWRMLLSNLSVIIFLNFPEHPIVPAVLSIPVKFM